MHDAPQAQTRLAAKSLHLSCDGFELPACGLNPLRGVWSLFDFVCFVSPFSPEIAFISEKTNPLLLLLLPCQPRSTIINLSSPKTFRHTPGSAEDLDSQGSHDMTSSSFG